jgi:hypothetical protein
MNVLLVILSGAEIGVWAALLFTSGFALHFWWTQRQLFLQDPSQKEKTIRHETERWKNRFLQETETLSRELDRLRKESDTSLERCRSLQAALDAKEELLDHLKQEHKTYRELLTDTLQSGESLDKRMDQLLLRSNSHPSSNEELHLNGEHGRTLPADLHRAELRIEQLELALMDKEDETERLKAAANGSGDVNEELLEKISQLESQVILARSVAEALEGAQTRIRELEEQLTDAERRRQMLSDSNDRLTEENQEQYNHFKAQMTELTAARQRLAQLKSQAEEPPRG